jgi:hypothetical protein
VGSLRARPIPAAATAIDWPRLRTRCLILAAAGLGIAQIILQATGNEFGYDFRGGTWAAGSSLLHGQSPFPAVSQPAYLLAHPTSFITPPPLAVLGAPFSLLPFPAAIVAFDLLSIGCLLWALRLLKVRDRGFIVIMAGSFPFISSLGLGQPDAVFALGAAVAWRWRDSDRGALAAGAIIAAKLLAWPLVLWLLVTRRFRQAAVAAGTAATMLLLSWATIGFRGLGSYPQLLAADARAFETVSHSLLTALLRSGLAVSWASPIAVCIAVAAAAAVVRAGRRSDLAWFTAALLLGILSSPIMWQHYLVLLFVAAAATRKLRDPLVWALSAALWLSPTENPSSLAQNWLIPLLAAAIAIRIAVLSRPQSAEDPARPAVRDELASALI